MFDADTLDDAFDGRAKEGLAGLPDGKDYTFEVTAAEMKKTANGGVLFHRAATVIGGANDGHKVTWDVWLVGKDGPNTIGMNQLAKELGAMGFDVDNWTKSNNRPFSKELVKAAAVMPGMRFKGAKTAKESNGKVYQNLFVNARADGDGKPAKLGAAEMEQAAKESIPF